MKETADAREHPVRPAPRLMLADDHWMVLRGLSISLQADFDVVGTATSGAGLLKLLARRSADCLLLDLQMPGMSGLELISYVRDHDRNLKILVLTMFAETCLADAALHRGAHGFVCKETPLRDLKAAIREVLSGRCYVSPSVRKRSHRLGMSADNVCLNRLTPRQQQIVLLLGEGRQLSEVARMLHVSPSTITFHKQNLMRALGIDSDADLLRFAVLVRAETPWPP